MAKKVRRTRKDWIIISFSAEKWKEEKNKLKFVCNLKEPNKKPKKKNDDDDDVREKEKI